MVIIRDDLKLKNDKACIKKNLRFISFANSGHPFYFVSIKLTESGTPIQLC